MGNDLGHPKPEQGQVITHRQIPFLEMNRILSQIISFFFDEPNDINSLDL